MVNIDEIDRALLRDLQINARQTNRELAGNAHIAPSTALDRIRSLQKKGIIEGYHAVIDLQKIGRSMQALIAVFIQPASRKVFESFRDWSSQLPEVIGVFVVSGKHDVLIHVAAADTNALYVFIAERLAERPEVASIQTSIIYSYTRKNVVDPLG